MKIGIIGLAILVALCGAVNLQAQTSTDTTAQASILGGGANLPPQPGPPPNATAAFLIAEGNALFTAGYYDAALQDFQRVINIEPDSSTLVSKGWYGLARVYMAQGNIELAKTSLEEVLTRNNDAESAAASRDIYKTLKTQADSAASQAQQALLYYQWRYQSTSFFSFISKFFAWRDLKNAEKAYEAAQMTAAAFNPRYLIAPIQNYAASEIGTSSTTAASETGTSLVQTLPTEGTGTTAGTGVSTTAQASTPAPAVTANGTVAQPTTVAPAAASSSTAATAAPADNLTAKRQAYLEAYKNLQTAMSSKDAAAIQAATKGFQEAMKAYNEARNRAASAQ